MLIISPIFIITLIHNKCKFRGNIFICRCIPNIYLKEKVNFCWSNGVIGNIYMMFCQTENYLYKKEFDNCICLGLMKSMRHYLCVRRVVFWRWMESGRSSTFLTLPKKSVSSTLFTSLLNRSVRLATVDMHWYLGQTSSYKYHKRFISVRSLLQRDV